MSVNIQPTTTSHLSRRRQKRMQEKKAARGGAMKAREPVISKRRQQRALNGLGLEPWRLLLALDTGVGGVDIDEFRTLFQEPVFAFDENARSPFEQLSGLDAMMDPDTSFELATTSLHATTRADHSDDLLRRFRRIAKDGRVQLFRVLVDPRHRCEWLVDVDAALFRLVSRAEPELQCLQFDFDSPQTRHSVYMIASFYGLRVEKPAPSTMLFRLPHAPDTLAAPAMSLSDYLAVRHAAN